MSDIIDQFNVCVFFAKVQCLHLLVILFSFLFVLPTLAVCNYARILIVFLLDSLMSCTARVGFSFNFAVLRLQFQLPKTDPQFQDALILSAFH